MELDVAAIRARLDHPVVDADGHVVEALPVLVDHIAKAAGDDVARRFVGATPAFAARNAYLLAKSDAGGRVPQPGVPMTPWWALPTTARDRATGFLPGLLHERLDEIGLDFSILYPSAALACIGHPDAAIRTGACQGLNTYLAELLDGYGDRLTAAAAIPTTTPEEALAELDHAVRVLGFKVVMLNDLVVRPASDGAPQRLDVLALDSEHDYDPVWARCVELGVAVTVHSPAQGHGLRTSSSRYMYNHIGNFGAAGDAFAKAVVFGGVAHRFPTLTFAFLEGGVAWGVQLLCDLVDRWHKRGGPHISQYDPSRLDRAEWDALLDRYGGSRFADPDVRAAMAVQSDSPPAELDDFRDAGVSEEGDLVRQFERFYFGCEADDATISWAFARHVNPHGAELRPILGSDLGHWDVADMTAVLPEAYELVADGLLDATQFRALSCDNAIRLHGSMNPAFFDGTVVEAYARQLLATEAASSAAG
jgi:predicted TIM-barrel fold metal-dependent hydrolase